MASKNDRAYTDAGDMATLNAAAAYTRQVGQVITKGANDYTDNKVSILQTSVTSQIDAASSQTLIAARNYTNQVSQNDRFYTDQSVQQSELRTKQYVDSNIADMRSLIAANRRLAANGTAAAMATPVAPSTPGKRWVGVACGSYDGATACGASLAYTTENGIGISGSLAHGIASGSKLGARIQAGSTF